VEARALIPIRSPIAVKPTAPTAPPGLTKGMARMSWTKGGRDDARPPGQVPRVAGYAPTVGPPGQLGGILPTPRVPGAIGQGDQRARFLAWVKTGGKRAAGTPYDQLLQSVQGGGRPLGPAYAGYINQLARTLLEGM
jgi:hypothetical protein